MRHLRFQYPTYMFATPYFEIDESGAPYWVCARMDKTIGLFGSYGWGDGEWMRTWEEDCGTAGINRVADSVICCEAPDDEALAACRALGRKLAE